MGRIDIRLIIKLLYSKYSSQERIDVVKALKLCDEGWWISDKYISFHHPLKHVEYKSKERVSLIADEGDVPNLS